MRSGWRQAERSEGLATDISHSRLFCDVASVSEANAMRRAERTGTAAHSAKSVRNCRSGAEAVTSDFAELVLMRTNLCIFLLPGMICELVNALVNFFKYTILSG